MLNPRRKVFRENSSRNFTVILHHRHRYHHLMNQAMQGLKFPVCQVRSSIGGSPWYRDIPGRAWVHAFGAQVEPRSYPDGPSTFSFHHRLTPPYNTYQFVCFFFFLVFPSSSSLGKCHRPQSERERRGEICSERRRVPRVELKMSYLKENDNKIEATEYFF